MIAALLLLFAVAAHADDAVDPVEPVEPVAPVEPIAPLPTDPLLPGFIPSPAPAKVLVTFPRESLVTLAEVRFRRARRGGIAMLVIGGVESVVGGAFLLASFREGVTIGTGIPLLGGGVVSLGTGLIQLDLATRRNASFRARLAEVEGGPREAYLGLAEEMRLSTEREARGYAFSTGVWGGLTLAGVLVAIAAPNGSDGEQAGIALGALGAAGTVHSAFRWRATVRLSVDFATLDAGVPTQIPTQPWQR